MIELSSQRTINYKIHDCATIQNDLLNNRLKFFTKIKCSFGSKMNFKLVLSLGLICMCEPKYCSIYFVKATGFRSDAIKLHKRMPIL